MTNSPRLLVIVFMSMMLALRFIVDARDRVFVKSTRTSHSTLRTDPSIGETNPVFNNWRACTVIWMPECGECSANVPNRLPSTRHDRGILIVCSADAKHQYANLLSEERKATFVPATTNLESLLNPSFAPRTYHIDATGHLDYIQPSPEDPEQVKNELRSLTSKPRAQ